MTIHPRSRERLLLTAGITLGGAALLASLGATFTLFLLCAAIGAIVVVRRPILGVLFFAVTIPIENLTMFGGATLTRIMGMGVFAGWLVHKLLYRESWKTLFQNLLLLPATLFVGMAALSILWAREPRLTLVGTFQLAQLFALSLLLLDVLDEWVKVERFVRTLVIGMLVASALTLYQYYLGGLRRAGEDVAGGVNNTAQILVTLLPFAFYMLRSSQKGGWRLVGMVGVVASIAAIAVTFSRMSLLLLPLVLATQFWETLRSGRGIRWLATVTVALGVVAATLVPWQELRDRTSSIRPYVEATVETPGGPEVVESSGRGYHMRVGLAIFADHPVLGVGYQNYGDYFLRDYQFEVRGRSKLYTTPRSPHSSNIGILADLGLAGFVLWLVLLGSGFYGVIRAWRAMRRLAHRGDGFFLVQAVAYSYGLQALAYSWYLPNQKQKIFWAILSTTLVVYHLALRAEDRVTASEPGQRQIARPLASPVYASVAHRR